MTRNELKELSKLRLIEAKHLLDGGFYDGAYYLCGYSVECALKACIAKHIKRYEFPDKRLASESFTHDVSKLVKLAGLEPDLLRISGLNSNFKVNWSVVKDWNETSRYQRSSRVKASDLYTAVDHRRNGIMSWVKKHW